LYTVTQSYVRTNTHIAFVCIGWLKNTYHTVVLRITVDIQQSVATT